MPEEPPVLIYEILCGMYLWYALFEDKRTCNQNDFVLDVY